MTRLQFVCFEGIDGAGKTTAALGVVAGLNRLGLAATYISKKDALWPNPYVGRHAQNLRANLWDHPHDDPVHELGIDYAAHLQFAWFSMLELHLLDPAIRRGQLVVMDNWFYKFLVRVKINNPASYDRIRQYSEHLRRPSMVVHLCIDPSVAASRKNRITSAEVGASSDDNGITRQAFVTFQTKVASEMSQLSVAESWANLAVGDMKKDQVVDYSIRAILNRWHSPSNH